MEWVKTAITAIKGILSGDWIGKISGYIAAFFSGIMVKRMGEMKRDIENQNNVIKLHKKYEKNLTNRSRSVVDELHDDQF